MGRGGGDVGAEVADEHTKHDVRDDVDDHHDHNGRDGPKEQVELKVKEEIKNEEEGGVRKRG